MDGECLMYRGDVNCTHNFVPSTWSGWEVNIKTESYRSRCYNLDCIDPSQENEQWRTRVCSSEHFSFV